MSTPVGDEFSVRFAKHLRDLMAERGVTQTAVAARLPGRSQSYVSERTGGVRPASFDIIEAVAAVIGLSPRAVMAEVLVRMDAIAE